MIQEKYMYKIYKMFSIKSLIFILLSKSINKCSNIGCYRTSAMPFTQSHQRFRLYVRFLQVEQRSVANEASVHHM